MLQWTLNSYVLTLAALVLVGGSLSDVYDRRRIFILGVAVFVAASALCAAAPTIGLPIAARFIQGIGGPPHPGEPGDHRSGLSPR